MSLQAIERKKHLAAPTLQKFFPVTRTVAGFEGYRFLKTVSEGVTDFTVQGSYALATNASAGLSIVGGVYYVGIDGYDAEFVKTIQAADAAEPEAGFNNVVDMLDWLNRD
jgi:hypothetical protein